MQRWKVAIYAAILTAAWSPAWGQGADSKSDVKQAVHRNWIEGIPAAEAAKYLDDSDLQILIQMLHDPKEAATWKNVVPILALSDNPASLKALVDFVRTQDGPVSPFVFSIKGAAILAIGKHITTNADARTFLREAQDRQWIRSNIHWWPEFEGMSADESKKIRDEDLIKKASVALKANAPSIQ